jgi:hypothetical protein
VTDQSRFKTEKCPFPDFGNLFCKILEMDDRQLGKRAFLCPRAAPVLPGQGGRCPRGAGALECIPKDYEGKVNQAAWIDTLFCSKLNQAA